CTAEFEIPRRCEAARTAFYSMGAFWILSTPWRWKRVVFQGAVMGAILSGMGCFMLSEAQRRRLDRCLASLVRIAMAGGATQRLDGGGVESTATGQVPACRKLADTKTELLVRRLRLYQSWARRHWHRARLLSALFVDLPGINAVAPCTDHGLLRSASPWTARGGTDVAEADNAMEDDAEDLGDLSQARWTLEADRDLAKQFVLLDFAKVRASKHAVSVPPPGAQQAERASDHAGADHDEEDCLRNIVVCGVRLEDGSLCIERFPTRRQLLRHQRSAHDVRNLCHILTKNSRCVVCERIFVGQRSAAKHLERSVQRGWHGRCESRAIRALQVPVSFSCDLCEFEGGSWGDFTADKPGQRSDGRRRRDARLKRGADPTGPPGSDGARPPMENKLKGKGGGDGGNHGGGGRGAGGMADLCKATAKLYGSGEAVSEAKGMLGEELVRGGQECDAESKEMKAGQIKGEAVDFKTRGSPCIRISCKAVLWAVGRTGPRSDAATQNPTVHNILMLCWKEHVMVRSPKQLEYDCFQFHCRKSRAGDDKEEKGGVLSMAFARQGAGSVVGPTLWTCIKELGALAGAAPRGPLEREASKCLAAVTGKAKGGLSGLECNERLRDLI
ncbi:unnamed protein product, partial [Prorocentrum cordatum]